MARRVKYLTKIFIFLIKLYFITVNMAKTRNKCPLSKLMRVGVFNDCHKKQVRRVHLCHLILT